jgi:hypothetical protein
VSERPEIGPNLTINDLLKRIRHIKGLEKRERVGKEEVAGTIEEGSEVPFPLRSITTDELLKLREALGR